MGKSEFISIAEFAARAGITKQAVYKRLPTIDRNLIRVDNGKKTIDINALQLFSVNSDNQRLKNKQPKQTNLETDLIAELRKQIDGLQADKRFLQDQVTELTKSLQYEQSKAAALQQLLPTAQAAENEPTGAGAGSAPDPLQETENSESGKNEPNEPNIFSFFGRIMRKKK